MRHVGTISMGVKLPILKEKDDLITVILDSLADASRETGLRIEEGDVVAVTESIVARTQGNYISVDEISESIKDLYNRGEKLDSITLYQPVLSRNRFAVILRGIARASKNVQIIFTIPTDEVGNEIISRDWYMETYGTPEFYENFDSKVRDFKHPFTGINYLDYYREIIESEDSEFYPEFQVLDNMNIKESMNMLICNVHDRDIIKKRLTSTCTNIFTLQDICHDKSEWGLLGSNKVDEETLKLFPSNSELFVNKLQQALKDTFGFSVECMVYGDGGFKCPVSGVWEELDPVISPAYTTKLSETPNEIKLKYFADDKFKDLSGDDLQNAIKEEISHKSDSLKGSMDSQGTTPRKFSDLLGSLSDLTSGSGDKGTPIVWIKNYFKHY